MIAFFVLALVAFVLITGSHISFGLLGDIIIGLFVTILVGAWLDSRKYGWKGRKRS